MKKLLIFTCIIALTLSCFTGCGERDENHIIVGASSTPHAKILEFIKEDYEALGYKLEIKIYTDYIMPNASLANDDLDAQVDTLTRISDLTRTRTMLNKELGRV